MAQRTKMDRRTTDVVMTSLIIDLVGILLMLWGVRADIDWLARTGMLLPLTLTIPTLALVNKYRGLKLKTSDYLIGAAIVFVPIIILSYMLLVE